MRVGATLALIAVSCLPPLGHADTLVVPDQYVTIQGAIDASVSGDTVLVRPGAYLENLLIVDKSLSLKSLGGPAATVIDGRFPTRPDTLSVVCALGAENLVLDGFTVRGGLAGSTFPDLPPGSGGGIFLAAVGGVVRNCVIDDNFCEGDGGGIYLLATSMLIQDCVIKNNQCYGAGGGLHTFLSSSLRVERCTIESNESDVFAALSIAISPTEIVDCVVRANLTHRAAIIGWGSSIRGTLVVDNGESGAERTRCVEADRIESCTIARNRNSLSAVAAGVLSRSIMAMNAGRAYACGGNPSVECCDVFGNGGGDDLCGTDLGGNFSLDPLLCSDDSIASESPCAPGHSPAGCGLIGALGIGCGAPVEPATWGQIKYRWR